MKEDNQEIKFYRNGYLNAMSDARKAIEQGLDDWDKLEEEMDEENAVCYTINRIMHHLDSLD